MISTKLFLLPVIGKLLLKLAVRQENGEKESMSLRHFTELKYGVKIDLYSYGSCFAPSFNNGGKVSIGRYCSFGPEVKYFGADHPVHYAAMSPYFYNKAFSGFEVNDVERHKLSIGNDVWVGGRVTIVSSCHSIGNGAVLAAGAVVTKDVPPYAIVGGGSGEADTIPIFEGCL